MCVRVLPSHLFWAHQVYTLSVYEVGEWVHQPGFTRGRSHTEVIFFVYPPTGIHFLLKSSQVSAYLFSAFHRDKGPIAPYTHQQSSRMCFVYS